MSGEDIWVICLFGFIFGYLTCGGINELTVNKECVTEKLLNTNEYRIDTLKTYNDTTVVDVKYKVVKK